MTKKARHTKKPKTMKELTKGYNEFMKTHKHNNATKEDFDKVIKKTSKPSSK